MTKKHTPSSREAALQALLAYERNGIFLQESLDQWIRTTTPLPADRSLAYEISYGVMRRKTTLEWYAHTLLPEQKLKLKRKERFILFIAIYQHLFMDRIPPYAIANEAVNLANIFCHKRFSSFLNAILRRFADTPFSPPQGHTPEEMSIRYSFPTCYIKDLLTCYTTEETTAILEASNAPGVTMIRSRSSADPFDVFTLDDNAVIHDYTSSPDYYIQNITSVELTKALASVTPPPQHILDICAAPGGKALLAHDIFPSAHLHLNDLTEKKCSFLEENMKKYHVTADITCSPGEKLHPDKTFDLIILDAPCSNSGVLHKRPEARWRLTPESLEALKVLQLQLLHHATTLLSPGGVIWFMTCSILKKENEELVRTVAEECGLTIVHERTILPSLDHHDGGYGCVLKK
jgi:16S rRNA (cytosine967-C5)-methyltransferase